MKTISDRITDIKGELDELEAHINSTLSVLDCKSVPLKEHDKDYKDWKWRTYNHYIYDDDKYTADYKTEEKTLEKLNTLKEAFDKIHEENKKIMEENTQTFNKICEFFSNIGLSKTSYQYSGKGRNRKSYKVESQWVEQLKRQYPMKDESYQNFISWHKDQEREIKSFFSKRREAERKKEAEAEQERQKREEQQKQEEEKIKAISVAVEFLVGHGKEIGKDFNSDNAIDKACELKMEIINRPEKKSEELEELKSIESKNALQFLDVEE